MRLQFTEQHVSRFDDISGEPSKLVRREYKDGSVEWFRKGAGSKNQHNLKPVKDGMVEVFEEEFQSKLN